MGNTLKAFSLIVGHGLTMRKNALKALPIYSSKWYIVLQTNSYNAKTNLFTSRFKILFERDHECSVNSQCFAWQSKSFNKTCSSVTSLLSVKGMKNTWEVWLVGLSPSNNSKFHLGNPVCCIRFCNWLNENGREFSVYHVHWWVTIYIGQHQQT